jgi:hypothetical protein
LSSDNGHEEMNMSHAAHTSDLTGLHRDRTVSDHDAIVLTWFGIALLTVLALILLALPFDLANGPQYVPGVFGP